MLLAMSTRIAGAVIAGMLGAAGAFLAWQASLLGLGDLASPGPGFFPFLLGAVLPPLACVIGFDCWRSGSSLAVQLGHRNVAIATAALLTVPLLFEPLGAPITLGLFGAASLILIGGISPLVAIPASGCASIACWYFFQVLLGVQLPAGPL